MPKLSIIIPFNNGKKYLYNCLENLKNIAFEDYEIILIDDFSQDDSEKIAQLYKNIKYYYTKEKTLGVGNARNLGIEKASGNYIMFVDVDDSIEKDLLKKIQPYMKKDVEMIKYKMKIINKKMEKKYINGPLFNCLNGEKAFNELCFQDNYLDSPCLYVIKKELFERTGLKFEKNVYHEDFGLIPLLILNAKSVVSTDVYGYNYFQSENSIIRNDDYSKKIKKIYDKLFLFDELYKKIEFMNLEKCTEQNLLEYYTNSIIAGINELKRQDKKLFRNIIKEKGLLNNLRVRNLKQMIKKIMLSSRLFYKISN